MSDLASEQIPTAAMHVAPLIQSMQSIARNYVNAESACLCLKNMITDHVLMIQLTYYNSHGYS